MQGREDGEAEAAALVEFGIGELLVDFVAAEERVAGLFDNRADETQAVGYGPCLFDFAGKPFGCAPV